MADGDDYGWISLHRRLRKHPVWRTPHYALTWIWMLMEAAYAEREDVRFGMAVPLARGELATSLGAAAEEVAGGHFNVKFIRSAFAFLERQGMVRLRPVKRGGKTVCTVVTVVKYDDYQRNAGETRAEPPPSPAAPASSPSQQERDSGAAAGHNQGHNPGHNAGTTGGITGDFITPCSGNALEEGEHGAGHNPGHNAGTTGGIMPGRPRGINNINNTKPPNPPFAKGGVPPTDSAAMLGTRADRVAMVLDMWREEWEKAGRCFVPDRNTTAAAELLVSDWLEPARLSAASLRTGMVELVDDIRTDPRCRRHDLRTLARNPSKYCRKVVAVPARPESGPGPGRTEWLFVCDTCGAKRVQALPRGEQPGPQECVRGWLAARRGGDGGCQGTMFPETKEAGNADAV